MNSPIPDIRYGLRMLAKNPGFTAAAVLSLVLGIGANATVFSWIETVLLHPLPGIEGADRLVAVETVMPSGEDHTSSYPDYKDYRDRNHVFSGTIGMELIGPNLKAPNDEHPQRDWGLLVTENYFDVLGVQAARGRTFHAADNRGPGSDPYIVLGYGFWQRRFGSDPSVVGQTIEIDEHPFTVIGVAPKQFMGTIVGLAAEYWVPMMMQPQALPGESLNYRAPTFIHIMGKLKPGVSLAEASAEMHTIAAQIAHDYADTSKDVGVYVCPIWKANYGLQNYLMPVLVFLMAVVLLVLLIACANIANLLMARATVREKEIAIRSALGASRGRLMRQLLAESILLSIAGGIGGVLVAMWSTSFLAFFAPHVSRLPVGIPLGIDSRSIAFTAILSICTGLFFGVVPAIQASRASVNETLKEGGHTSSMGAQRHGLRNLLVIGETVVALVLLIGAGLLVRSLHAAETSNPGYNVDHVLLTALDLRGIGYSDDQSSLFFARLVDRVKALPGVRSASMERWVPLWFTGRGYTRPNIEGYTPKPGEDVGIDYNVVGADYFSTMQIPVLSGREFTARDGAQAPHVCMVNETMAEHFWPGEDPLGHRLNSWDQWWTVVGVVRDVKYHSMNEQPESFVYFPMLQDTGADANILIRTSGNPDALLSAVRQQIYALDPNAAVLESANLRELFNVSLFAYRTAATLAVVLGIVGLLLAACGIYGVLSYSVSQRTHEIGIRMTLGAEPRNVLGLVVGQGMRLALLGVVAGVVVAIGAMRLISTLLYGVTASDPLTFFGVAAVLAAVALLACCVPALRAMRVDPMVALRYE